MELFVSDSEKLLEGIGRDFAKVLGSHQEGPFIFKYQAVFPVSELTKDKYATIYNRYVDQAVLSGKKYGIQLKVELLCGM
jgi:hypothetical protein